MKTKKFLALLLCLCLVVGLLPVSALAYTSDANVILDTRVNNGWWRDGGIVVFRYGYPATTAEYGEPRFELQYNGGPLNGGPANLDAESGSWPGEAGYPHTHGTDTGYLDGVFPAGVKIQDILFELAAANGDSTLSGVTFLIYDTYEIGIDGECWGWNKNPLSSNFTKPILVQRAGDFSGTMIVNNAKIDEEPYEAGTGYDPQTKEPGRMLIHNTTIDNATANATSSDPNKRDVVAVRCNEGSLLMLGREQEKGVFTNWENYSSTIVNSNDAGHGTGVLLSNTSGGTGHLPSTDYVVAPDMSGSTPKPGQTYAEAYGGSVEFFLRSYIDGQYIGVDSQYGRARLKDSSDPLRGNTIDVNLAYGNALSKWIDSIARIYENPIDIVLQDIEQWHSGDIVMDSGLYWQGTTLTHAPVVSADTGAFDLDRTGLSNMMGLEYYRGSGVYPYPVIRFYDGVVYNTRTGQWYKTLYDAVTMDPSAQTDVTGAPTQIQDGDTLVF